MSLASTDSSHPDWAMKRASTDGTPDESDSKLEAGSLRGPAAENIVDWDGPDDPENPLNWTKSRRFGHVVIVALLSMVVNLAATILAPGVGDLVRDFHITSSAIRTLTVTLYLLGFALGPLIISSVSELHGRLIVYHVCNVLFVAFIIGSALSKNVTQLLVFRFFSGCAGAAPLTIGGGTIADVTSLQERALAAALFGLGPLLGPVIGPVIGGFLAAHAGWRWTFWLMAITGGVTSIISWIFMSETHPNIILERKTTRLRRETGNKNLESRLDRHLTHSQVLIGSFVRTTKLLIFSPLVLVMSIYVGLIFGLLYLLFTTIPIVFRGQYGFGEQISGLAYLGLGMGELSSLAAFGILTDRVTKRRMEVENLTEAKPEHRLILMIWFSPLIGVGMFIYGWTAYYQVHWIVPIIGTFFVGFGAFFVIMPSQLYLVDIFGSEAAASALGANILLRSLCGAFLPLAGPSMYATLNYGWGNTLLGFLALAFVPVPILFYKYGEWLRNLKTVKL